MLKAIQDKDMYLGEGSLAVGAWLVMCVVGWKISLRGWAEGQGGRTAGGEKLTPKQPLQHCGGRAEGRRLLELQVMRKETPESGGAVWGRDATVWYELEARDAPGGIEMSKYKRRPNKSVSLVLP